MKTKLIALILVVLMLVLAFSGCAEQVCEHTYTSTVTKEATYDTEGEITYTCSKCGDTYTATIERLVKHTVPQSVLDDALSNSRYYSDPFSISVAKLVNSAMDNYDIQYFSGEEAIENGYLSRGNVDSSVDLDCLYYAIISGDAMVNPEIPYMTQYEARAVEVWMVFDENDRLINSGVTLCSNLQTCAIVLMTRGY